jgi:N-formylglutamate amidohydrolase
VHAVQIELSRALYLDEARIEKTDGFAHCRARLAHFVERLTQAPGRWRSPKAAGGKEMAAPRGGQV